MAPLAEHRTRRSVIGVFPAASHAARPRLFSTLTSALDADFVPRSRGEQAGLDGAMVFGDAALADELVATGVPCLVLPEEAEPGPGRPELVRLAATSHLDDRLHNRAILDAHASVQPLGGDVGGTVVASTGAGPIWVVREHRAAALHRVASAPAELGADERLKDRLRSGRFSALVPLIQLVRNLGPAWERPPVRASFVLDDANLHWRSYGYLRFPPLVRHAAANGYHLGVAMIPLDGWLAEATTVQCLRGHHVSLLVHGNNHTSHELGRSMTTEDASTMVATALRRISAFEGRTGVAVQRVMSPPHGRVSETMMSVLRRSGFAGTCYWGPTDDTPPALVGWNPADVHLGGGFPGMQRLPIDAPLDELVLRAFLDQPLLLSGHHVDLAAGLGVLGDACARVGLLGGPQWMSVSDALASNVLRRLEGTVLRVRPFSRRFRVELPEGVTAVVVEWTGSGDPSWVVEAGRAPLAAGTGEEIPVTGSGPLDIEARLEDGIDPQRVGRAPWRPWPVARRVMTEGRDRLQPVLRAGRASA